MVSSGLQWFLIVLLGDFNRFKKHFWGMTTENPTVFVLFKGSLGVQRGTGVWTQSQVL